MELFGIVRPCTHRLTDHLKTQWMAHLCGLCLALRADHGQFARVVTNYDGLIVSVLTEAQTGVTDSGRRTAGPCPLRAMRTAPSPPPSRSSSPRPRCATTSPTGTA